MMLAPGWVIAVTLVGSLGVAQAEGKKLDLRSSELYMKTLSGEDTKLAPFAGSKMTLLNLWATWCGPCREEMPALDTLHKKYKAQGFAVVGLDVDEGGEVVKKFLAKQKVGYPMLLSTPQKTVPALGDLESLPTSLLLDETGDVLEVLIGGIEVPYLEKAIEKRLGKPIKAAKK
jgi:thiol-disulfide isomerase/thioredoxin